MLIQQIKRIAAILAAPEPARCGRYGNVPHFTGTFAGAAPLHVEVAGKTLPQQGLKGSELSFESVELPEGKFPLKLVAGKPEGQAKKAILNEISFTKI